MPTIASLAGNGLTRPSQITVVVCIIYGCTTCGTFARRVYISVPLRFFRRNEKSKKLALERKRAEESNY